MIAPGLEMIVTLTRVFFSAVENYATYIGAATYIYLTLGPKLGQ